MRTLSDFSTPYEKFDKTISDFSIDKTTALEIKTADALIELNTKAHFQLSSLVKNDNVIPLVALEIADL